MEKEKAAKLKELISNEIAFRKEFQETRDKLESMIDPITEHVKECCDFWGKYLPDSAEIVVTMDNGTSMKILRPKKEVASVESYLPYGIDFQDCLIIDIE